ncbi:MAG TPA: hypothetical protein VGE40_00080, partial [Bacilli bacterium]
NPGYYNLTQQLSILQIQGDIQVSSGGGDISSGMGDAPTIMNKIMAGSMLTILPLLILYLFTQRYFVEGVERAGIAGD